MRYEIGKNFNTKDWFVYDNETNRNVCLCDTKEEAQTVVSNLIKKKQNMNLVIDEVVEFIKSYDGIPTKENIKNVLIKWIENLYSHIGAEAHKHSLACGIVDETGMTWEEQDMLMLQQIARYKKCLDTM